MVDEMVAIGGSKTFTQKLSSMSVSKTSSVLPNSLLNSYNMEIRDKYADKTGDCKPIVMPVLSKKTSRSLEISSTFRTKNT